MDEPGDAPVTVTGAVSTAVESPWAKVVTRFLLPALVTGIGLLTQGWFTTLNQTLVAHGVAIEAIAHVNDETHRQVKAFRDETAQRASVTARRLEAIEEETSRKLEAIREENRNLSNQIKEIEPRVKEIEQKVKGQ